MKWLVLKADMSGQYSTGAEVSYWHFAVVPKCLGSEVAWVRSILTPMLWWPFLT